MINKFYYDSDIFRIKYREYFDTIKQPQTYNKNQIIYLQGDDANYVYYLKSGKIEIFLNSAGGSEKTLTVMSAGSLFGKASFFDKVPRTSSARALEKSEIISIDRNTMMLFIKKNPEFAMDLLESLSKTVRMLSDQVDIMTFAQADKRIAQYIINTYLNSPTKPFITCTHEEICEQIGASRVTVSKILGQFRKNGWVETHYRQLKVVNIEQIMKYEEEC